MAESAFNAGRLDQILRKVYFFDPLKMHELEQLISHMRMSRYQKGAVIITQGEVGNAFYLIASGRVSVWIKKTFGKSKVAELHADQFFGEMALISNEKRSATVIAEEVTEVFVLYQRDFESILLKNPAVAHELKKAYLERKQKNR